MEKSNIFENINIVHKINIIWFNMCLGGGNKKVLQNIILVSVVESIKINQFLAYDLLDRKFDFISYFLFVCFI